ncbi:HNH endonuclease signature motif containing protein [Pelagerythrobacter marinus]|uniref:HNH endonuclease signature motif containing protein n=1 Tax=Pelagerythrobacter marinus TaxID=538382 RepID=UPI002AC94277|nr:HNH endonuclease signature motif containing protein [Pelagerythrobacter marinus]WPZ05482.1 HNH endonuclease signature motif containing protein [Pelagerythrobacter marinus]
MIMKLTPTKHFGHLTVGLDRNGEKRRYLVHRLVCEAFHGPCPPDKRHCAHWDGDPTNNNSENLRWATVKENAEDTRRHGNLRVGEDSNLSRLTETQVLEIRAKAAAGRSGYSLGKEYGISSTGALKIIRRENWKHI